jgi:methylated-DNA-[protein]-cysteine S-methyltransferase
VVATAFGNVEELKARSRVAALIHDETKTAAAREQVIAYFAGRRTNFDLRFAANGTAFQRRVWGALCLIPLGETRTYGQLAAQLGNPNASRAVGRANATNPSCLIVPCHRVIGANGSLTGFAFGEDIKQRLLEHERRLVMHSSAA